MRVVVFEGAAPGYPALTEFNKLRPADAAHATKASVVLSAVDDGSLTSRETDIVKRAVAAAVGYPALVLCDGPEFVAGIEIVVQSGTSAVQLRSLCVSDRHRGRGHAAVLLAHTLMFLREKHPRAVPRIVCRAVAVAEARCCARFFRRMRSLAASVVFSDVDYVAAEAVARVMRVTTVR